MSTTKIQEKPLTKTGKTLSILELSELVSAIRNFSIEINDFDEDKETEEMIDTNSDVALFLEIGVVANTYKDNSDYSYNGNGHDSINNEDGYFTLRKIRPYYEGIGDCELDELSMKVIIAEINNLNIF